MDETDSPGPARRWFLIGGIAVLAGAAGGVGLELLTNDPPPSVRKPPAPPALLVAAAEAERLLIADLDATTGGSAAVRVVIRQARADHAAHLRMITGLIASSGATVPAAIGTTPASIAKGAPRTVAELRGAEQRASAGAARRAAQLRASQAALFASIAACEASHAELFG